MTKKPFLGWAILLGLAALHCSGGDELPEATDFTGGTTGGTGAPIAGQPGAGTSAAPAGTGGTGASGGGAGVGFGTGGLGTGGTPAASGTGGGAGAGGNAGAFASLGGAGTGNFGGRFGAGGSMGGSDAVVAAGGMSTGGSGIGGMTSGGMTGAAGAPSAFAPVKEIIGMSCGTTQCHPNKMNYHMDLHDTDGKLYTRLMSGPTGQMVDAECMDRALVVPGDAAGSLLVQMIEAADAPRAKCGERMPHDCPEADNPCLTAAAITTIKDWITAGALP